MAVETIDIKDANGITQRIAVDKVGTDNVQIVKAAYGVDDSFSLVTPSSGLPVNVIAGSAVGTEYTEGAVDSTITGTAILWEDTGDVLRPVSAAKPLPISITAGSVSLTGTIAIEPDTAVSQVTPVISTSAYTAGDVVGGQMVLTNAMLNSGAGATLQSLTVVDKSPQSAALNILFFSAAATIAADNAAFTWNSADYAKCLGVVKVATTDYVTVGGDAVATVYPSLVVYGNGTQSIYAVMVAVGTPTFGSSSDLILNFGFLRAN